MLRTPYPFARRLPAALLVLGSLSIAAAAHGQPVSGAFHTEVVDDGATLLVTVRLWGSPSFDLGSSNVAFTFNTAALSLPLRPVQGVHYDFAAYQGGSSPPAYLSTVTRTGDEVSVNIGLQTIQEGLALPEAPTDVARIRFAITDASQQAQLRWTFAEVQDASPALVASSETTPALLGTAFAHAAEAPLPVELFAFAAVPDGGAVRLAWKTASETNNAGFHVEVRRAECDTPSGSGAGREGAPASPGCASAPPAATASPWRAIAFVEGHGTTSAEQAYVYRAAGLEPGAYAFRLRQVDFDGAAAYGPVVEVQVALPGAFYLGAAYPNPFHDAAHFTLTLRETERVTVVVHDVLGREVARLHDGLLASGRAHAFTVGSAGWPSGLYFVTVAGPGYRTTRAVTRVR